MTPALRMLRGVTCTLLVAYPLSWTAPLLRAGLLPLFGLSEISILTGIVSLWKTDVFLALIVALFALIAPMAKILWLILLQWDKLSMRGLRWLEHLGRLAMTDLFLIALYITAIKGLGVGRVEVAWGLYLFSGCILLSLVLSALTPWIVQRDPKTSSETCEKPVYK